MKILFYIPLHLFNLLQGLFPFNLTGYSPSSETIRIQEETIQNKIRLIEYKAKKLLTSNKQ